MDFFSISVATKQGKAVIFPSFNVGKADNLMVRGHAFYAIWDEERNFWSRDELDVARIVDRELDKALSGMNGTGMETDVKWMSNYSSGSWKSYCNFIKQSPDNWHELDNSILFSNMEVTKKSYATKQLSYPLEQGSIKAYDQIMSTLYSPEEREKIEWAIGSIIKGDSKTIQKFLVLYGEAGTGKSTVLNIIQKLFDGYYRTFEAKTIGSSNNQFSVEQFRTNPLIGIQHDGDLSKIEDNTKLNSIISHEEMVINEKYKSAYSMRLNTFLFMATNKPVKITDAKSGIIRRLIDVKPTGEKIPVDLFTSLFAQIDFELSGIAYHCLDVYKKLGKNYYNSYVPFGMMFETDVFFNFVDEKFDTFLEMDGIALKQAYTMYKEYCADTLVEYKLPMYRFREELKHYFREFYDRATIDGERVYKFYKGFKAELFAKEELTPAKHSHILILDQTESILDEMLKDEAAQYGNEEETPCCKWENVKTTLKDLNTRKLHYVKLPLNHIVIDFDLKDENGKKDKAKNLEEAAKWPSTYAELSKGGNGVHLHYIYQGDPTKLSRVYQEGIEVKIFTGNSSLRRKLSVCNAVAVAAISSGLPLKEEKVINQDAVKSERGLRALILKNLRKEIHPGTKPSIDFIYKILEDAYNSGLQYDVNDLRGKVLSFAMNSTNHADYCVKMVAQMHFSSQDQAEGEEYNLKDGKPRLVFFDVEVYSNLFVICWKYHGEGDCVRMINPSPGDVEKLFSMPLVGFNNRRYDNHILYARTLGYSNEELFSLSQKIINAEKGKREGFFGAAYNISYTDIYDFSVKKQSLKKWEIELGIHHQEMDIPWDKPVPDDRIQDVCDYCCNDVIATEKLFDHLKEDFAAREVLAKLSGLTVNDSTQSHTARIIFGKDPHPQDKFVYTDLSEMFPGYQYDRYKKKSTYRGVEVGEGGYVYAEPGMYFNVALLDVASLHPTSLIELNLFGPYTKNFADIKESRIAVKHQDMEKIKTLLNGKLWEVLQENPDISLESLGYSMKIVINMIYGFTSATFDSKFRDPRNIDNIVAKRGALFMVNLQHECQKRGWTVAHIKTDSIKLPNATPEMIQFVMDYGKQYGYEFEHEATYDRMCLVNDAVYIAKYDNMGVRNKGGKHAGEWTATGAQFAHPYVFKHCFSKETIVFDDLCEKRAATSNIYVDVNEGLPDVRFAEATQDGYRSALNKFRKGNFKPGEYDKFLQKYNLVGVSDVEGELIRAIEDLNANIAPGHNYVFVGKVGLFCPMQSGCGAGNLVREKDGKYYAVTDTTGYLWMESEMVKRLHLEEKIDMSYFAHKVDDAVENISRYGDYEMFVSGPPVPPWTAPDESPSWVVPF